MQRVSRFKSMSYGILAEAIDRLDVLSIGTARAADRRGRCSLPDPCQDFAHAGGGSASPRRGFPLGKVERKPGRARFTTELRARESRLWEIPPSGPLFLPPMTPLRPLPGYGTGLRVVPRGGGRRRPVFPPPCESRDVRTLSRSQDRDLAAYRPGPCVGPGTSTSPASAAAGFGGTRTARAGLGRFTPRGLVNPLPNPSRAAPADSGHFVRFRTNPDVRGTSGR